MDGQRGLMTEEERKRIRIVKIMTLYTPKYEY